MTEREYVQFLRKRASDYMDAIAGDIGGEVGGETIKAAHAWDAAKAHLSPFTLIRMCDAWLEQDEEKVDAR
jgi:hypothetical protein